MSFIGLAIGFLNEAFRILAWSLSLIILAILIIFLIFRDYVKRIEINSNEILEIRKDLNISSRLSKLEGKIEVLEKR